MIENDKQYEITQTQLQRLESALVALRTRDTTGLNIHPRLLQAEEDGLRSLIEDLQAEVRDYEALAPSRR